MIAHEMNQTASMTKYELTLQALADTLGPAGMVKFITNGRPGSGNFTEEKYDRPEPTIEEIFDFLEKHEND